MEKITITKNDEHFDGITWVARAVLKKSPYNPELECIHIDNNAVVATDRVRMHVYYCNSGIEPGNYKIITSNKTCIVLERFDNYNFPDWKSVVGTSEYWSNHHEISMEYGSDNHFFNLAHIIRNIPDDRTINYNLVESLIHDVGWCVYTKKESVSPIKFVNTYKNLVGLIALVGVSK